MSNGLSKSQAEQLETMNKRFVGKRVLIVGDHPHVDRIGTVDRAEKTPVGWGYVVKFAQGDSCFVYSGKNWRILSAMTPQF